MLYDFVADWFGRPWLCPTAACVRPDL